MRFFRIFLSTFLLCAASLATAEIYKIVDKQGRVSYTDVPPANTKAKLVELPDINTVPGTSGTPPVLAPSDQQPPDIAYRINIASPSDGFMLMPEDRDVDIAVSLDPSLQEDLFIAYFIDGNLIEETSAQSITLHEPPRGQHKLYAEIKNKYGKSFGQSTPVTIIVMRPIAKQKAGGVPATK